MIRVRYTTTSRAAEPVVYVLLGYPDRSPASRGVVALLDTGADRSAIPQTVADDLGLHYAGTKSVEIAGGTILELPLYEVSLRIPEVMDFVLEVVAADETRVLIGRDVLDCLYLQLNGPTRILELSDQPFSAPVQP